MAHPGELDPNQHPHGITSGIEPVHILRFPLTGSQAKATEKEGGVVDNVSVGQEVVLRNGVRYFHGTDDGLHV